MPLHVTNSNRCNYSTFRNTILLGPRNAKRLLEHMRNPRSSCTSAQSDQGLHYPLIESFDTTEFTKEEQCPDNTLRVRKIICIWVVCTFFEGTFSFDLAYFNLYHSLGIFSRRQNDDIFLIFPRKQDLTFHANCLLRRQFAWNVKSCFLGKIRKIFQNVVCWKFYPEC